MPGIVLADGVSLTIQETLVSASGIDIEAMPENGEQNGSVAGAGSADDAQLLE